MIIVIEAIIVTVRLDSPAKSRNSQITTGWDRRTGNEWF